MPLERSDRPTPRIDAAVKEIRDEMLRHTDEIEGSTGLMNINLKVKLKHGRPFRVVFDAESEHHCSE